MRNNFLCFDDFQRSMNSEALMFGYPLSKIDVIFENLVLLCRDDLLKNLTILNLVRCSTEKCLEYNNLTHAFDYVEIAHNCDHSVTHHCEKLRRIYA